MALQNLGQTVKMDAPAKQKPYVEYPEISVSSSQLKGFDKAKIGAKCQLVFQGEVISLRRPSNWDVQRGEGKNETLGTIRLLRGTYVKSDNGGSGRLSMVKAYAHEASEGKRERKREGE